MLPYGRQHIDDDDVAAVVAALRSDHLTTGPQVAGFEADLARHVGDVPVVAMSSGTAALHAAYAAAGLGPGAELVTTPLTFMATAAAAVALGAGVRFADVDGATLTLDPQAAAAAVTPATRVVTAVDYAGHPADYAALRGVADAQELILVDDAAHALGSRWRGRPVGAVADLTTFSFHPVKTITTAEGGAVAVARRDLLPAVQAFRSHGMVRDPALLRAPNAGGWHQEVQTFGLNYRMPDVLAALGRSQLRKLDRFVARRRALADRYGRLLSDVDGLRLPNTAVAAQPAWHLYAIRVPADRRREIYERLRAAGIGVQVHYLPAHLHPVFTDLGYRQGLCPVAEQAYRELLSLPLHPSMTDADQDRVITAMRVCFGN